MSALSQASCEVCRIGAPKVTESEAQELMKQIPEWSLIEVDDIQQLERHYKFKNFVKAMAFANQLAEVAEAEGHHPGMLVEWGKVTVSWWSHSIKGLHNNDFVMAAKTDALLNQ